MIMGTINTFFHRPVLLRAAQFNDVFTMLYELMRKYQFGIIRVLRYLHTFDE